MLVGNKEYAVTDIIDKEANKEWKNLKKTIVQYSYSLYVFRSNVL